jgi:hypothetical protein
VTLTELQFGGYNWAHLIRRMEIAMITEAKAMSNVKQAVPFFRVTDIEASLRFYVDGLGFADGYRLDFESPTDVPEETVYAG